MTRHPPAICSSRFVPTFKFHKSPRYSLLGQLLRSAISEPLVPTPLVLHRKSAMSSFRVALRGKADTCFCTAYVRSWPLATSLVAPHMSAVGGKADMTGCRCPLLRSLLGLKRTWVFAAQTAFDPMRTFEIF